MDIHIDTENRWIASPLAGPAGLSEIPLFPYSAEIPVVVYLEDAAGDPAEILGAGWTANLGISTTALETDTPEVWVPVEDLTVDETEQTLTCLANCMTVAFKTAITGQAEPVDAWLGIKLYAPGETKPRYCYRVRVLLDNIVYDEGIDPPEEPLSDYYTKSETAALLAGKAASHPNRTDIGRDLADSDDLFVGFGLRAACSRLYTYIAGKMAAAFGLLTTAQKETLTGGGDADSLHTHAGGAGGVGNTLAVAGTLAGNLYAQTGSGWVLFDQALHAGQRMGYCGAAGTLTLFGDVVGGTGMTPGAPLYAGATAGAITQTAPTEGNTCVVGWAADASTLYVWPYAAWGGDSGGS